jgi:hypothetical protein
MGRSEEAGFRCLAGLRLGLARGRASTQRAKSVVSASFSRLPSSARTASGGRFGRVAHAITPDTWPDHTTDEVPRCLPPQAAVSDGYKQHVKGPSDASGAGTESYRPRLQGWQQSRSSSPGAVGGNEGQNPKQSVQAPETRTVSGAIPATKWPAGTSFRKPALTLRNIPTGSAAAPDGPGTTS